MPTPHGQKRADPRWFSWNVPGNPAESEEAPAPWKTVVSGSAPRAGLAACHAPAGMDLSNEEAGSERDELGVGQPATSPLSRPQSISSCSHSSLSCRLHPLCSREPVPRAGRVGSEGSGTGPASAGSA